MLGSVTTLANYDATVPKMCMEKIGHGTYQNNAESANICRKTLLLAEANKISFPDMPDLEKYLDNSIEAGKKLDSRQISEIQYAELLDEADCQFIEGMARQHKKSNIDPYNKDIDKRLGEECRDSHHIPIDIRQTWYGDPNWHGRRYRLYSS